MPLKHVYSPYGNFPGGITLDCPDGYDGDPRCGWPTSEGSPSSAGTTVNQAPAAAAPQSNVYQDAAGVYRNRDQMAQGGGGGAGGGYNVTGVSGGNRGTGGYGFSAGMSGEAWGDSAGGGGGAPGGGGRSSIGGGGGGGMAGTAYSAGPGAVRTQYANLNPNVWGQPLSVGNAQASAGTAGQFASELGGISPQVGAAPRTLYDQYQSHLMNPEGFQNNPIVKAAMDRAMQAASRKLAASRISRSGNAAQAISDTTAQSLLGQYGNFATMYGQGAQLEGQRYASEAGLGLDAVKARIAALQGGGQLALGAGQLNIGASGQQLEQQRLELQRVQSGIAGPQEQYQADLQAQQRAAAYQPPSYNAMTTTGVGYGPSLASTYGQQAVPNFQTWSNDYWAR